MPQQLAAEQPDRRLEIITEQADRLSRMVRQLLTVSRIESGALRSRLEVFAPVPRVRRTWEALGATEIPFTLEDRSEGWLALGDRDQLDQVLWALLDNAVGYGGRTPIDVTVALDPATKDLLVTDRRRRTRASRDEDRERLFGRFERGSGRPSGEGSGLGLYASRALCRAMGGDLELDTQPGRGPAPASASGPRSGRSLSPDRVLFGGDTGGAGAAPTRRPRATCEPGTSRGRARH